MLNIINNLNLLRPFFEDCYSELGVREYSKKVKISPPTASKILKEFNNQNLLKMRKERRYLLFRANRENRLLKDLSILYWKTNLLSIMNYLEDNFSPKSIILFGSLTKLEATKNSDIDLCIISPAKEEIVLNSFEKKYKRKIQLFVFDSIEKINKELKSNVLKGVFLLEE